MVSHGIVIVGRAILTHGMKAAIMYARLKTQIMLPHAIAAIVGRISQFKGHRVRPDTAH